MTKYDPKHAVFLDSDERRKRLPPEEIIELIDLDSSSKIMDLGAGTGFLTFPLSERVTEGKVYAVDVQKEMLKMLEKKCEEKSCRNIEIVHSNEGQIPISDRVVDHVFSINVLHEIKDFETLEEVKRIMKKHADICVVDWDKDVITERGPPTHERFTIQRAINKMKKLGFNIKQKGKFQDHFWLVGNKI